MGDYLKKTNGLHYGKIKRSLNIIQIIPLTQVSADLIAWRVGNALVELLKVKEYHLHTLAPVNKRKPV